jgi:opacity protein-like surface antigen
MRRLLFAWTLLFLISAPTLAQSAEFGDIDLSVYAMGSWPRDSDIYNQGDIVPASIGHGYGAGLKVGLFPDFTNRLLGLEIDSSAHGGSLAFPNSPRGQDLGTSRSDLLIINTMFNLILRYPGELITPYIGIGAGWSQGILLNPNIAGRADKDFDAARALGHQYLTGLRIAVSPKVFVYGEYRYFSANYHWEGLAMDFRTHYGIVGVGLHF